MTRFGYVMVTYFSIMGVAIASFIPTPTRLVWNVSASAPIGLYAIDQPGDLTVTDLVAVDPPEPLADFMVERGYIGRGVPLWRNMPNHEETSKLASSGALSRMVGIFGALKLRSGVVTASATSFPASV